MKKSFKKIWTIAFSVAIMLLCALLATSCSGFTVTPDDNGGVIVKPGTGDEEKDPPATEVHTHTYATVDSSENTYSCTEDRVIVYRCKCGAEISESAKAPGHDIRSYEGKAATCFEDGCEPYEKCIRGNCTYTTYKAIPALNHSLTKLADVAPTCTLDGAKDRTKCTRAGCNYSTETVVPSLGHIRNRVEGKAATCTQDGYTSYEICSRAGCSAANLSQPTVMPASGHDLTHYEAKSPTCTEFGWKAYSVCKKCTYSSYEKLGATGHSYKSGYCSSCGQEEPKHVHAWGAGEISVAATCTSAGTMKYTCTSANCGETKYEEIAAVGHSTTRYPAKNPTCTEEGWYVYEECKNCNYNTYAVAPAMGHSYDSGVVTTAATCTQSGVRTYSCVNGSCKKKVTTEIEKLGHDWGSWYVHTEPTCDSVGQERRICFNDSNHVDNRTISKLGHAWTEYSVIKNPTCTEEGQKKRTCNNNSAHEEIMPVPVVPHDVVLSTGICNNCKNVINQPLDTPVITSFNNYVIFWNAVEGADHYEVRVVYNGKEDYKKPDSLSFSLEKYFRECNSLEVYLRAMSPEGSTTPNSAYYMDSYSVGEGSIVNYEGVGKTVNLLTNTYTNYGTGTTSIFNKYMFNRLMAGDLVTLAKHYGDNVYTESISEYTNNKTSSIKNKVTQNASIGIDKIGKITGGYTFELDENYTQKTYNQTQAVFYDAYYEYRGYQAGIDGFSNPEILYSLLSDEFIRDAGYLQSGEMSPEAFITKYGTHVITAGIYGAKFNAHYEMLANKETLENTGKIVSKSTVTAGIEAVLKGVKVSDDVTSETTLTLDDFISSNSTDKRVIFEFSAVGGSHIAPTLSISDFASVSQAWADSMTNESDYVLIDVPDGSLYFIWDFLGAEHSEAKKILNDYFYARCDEQLDALNNKINGMYKDFFNFDYETGTLTFDLSALQEPYTDTTSLKDVLYMDGTAEIFNGATGKFTIYSKFNGHDVKKIVFEGGYNTRESQHNALIDAYFDGVYVVFNESWTNDRDIIVEFKNFAYHAPAGCAALDYNTVGSKNITMIVTGENMLTGGTGVSGGDSGFVGINAVGKNLVIKGSGALEVFGGNGADGAVNGGVGGAGADGIVANTVTVDLAKNVEFSGGAGGNGSEGRTGSHTSDAGNGGNGGNGGMAINCQSLSLMNSNALIAIIGGNGGHGGKGGYIPNGSNNSGMYNIADAGNGGNGGNGGVPILVSSLKDLICSSLELKHGNGGNGGDGGDGGDPVNGDFCPDGWSYGGHAGYGGNGFIAGDGGDGGQGGDSTGHKHGDLFYTKERGGAGNGGNGGNGGNMVSSVLYVSGVAQSIKSNVDCGKFGVAGSGGFASGYDGVYGYSGASGIDGENGTTDNSYYIEFEELLQQSVN